MRHLSIPAYDNAGVWIASLFTIYCSEPIVRYTAFISLVSETHALSIPGYDNGTSARSRPIVLDAEVSDHG